MADDELVRCAAAGDHSAFAALVAQHKGRIFGLASRFTTDAHQLDDLVQETFIRAWQRIGQFRGDSPFEHWLTKLSVHVCYDFLRRSKRRFFWQSVPLEEVEIATDNSDRLSAEEARERVEKALTHLNPKERLVITLLELEERTVREVADLTGWSEANVKVRAFRAREALKKILLSDKP